MTDIPAITKEDHVAAFRKMLQTLNDKPKLCEPYTVKFATALALNSALTAVEKERDELRERIAEAIAEIDLSDHYSEPHHLGQRDECINRARAALKEE